MARYGRFFVVGLVLAVLVAACGGDDESGTGGDTTAPSTETTAAPDAGGDEPAAPGAGGGNGGSLVLGDETITFDSARCFLQEQEAAAGGGKILFVAQAFGTNADGEPVSIDVSRYDEDSDFTGDDILVDIGDPFSDDAVSWSSRPDLGTVTVDGSRLSADGLPFQSFDIGAEATGSFEINC